MNIKLAFPILISLIFLLFPDCSKDRKNGNLVKLGYGTYFGKCLGYCNKQILITSGSVEFIKSNRLNNIQEVTWYKNMDAETWEELKNSIDITNFSRLPETIGCPDCADGGSEWIEVYSADGSVHKSTFEYHKEPEATKKYIGKLRELISELAIYDSAN